MKQVKQILFRQKWLAVLLVAELVLLLGHFVLAMQVQAPVVLSGSELEALSEQVTVADGSITLADSENYGPFAQTPLLSLKKGTYTATVTYESSLEGAKVYQDNDYITMNEQVLEASDRYASFSLWANGDTATSFKVSYNGGTRTIYQFTLTPTHAYARVSTLGWLLFFVLLDLLVLARRGLLPVCRADYTTRLLYLGLAGVIFFQSLPLMAGFLFSGHDLNFHLYRIQGIADGLAAGELPVKIYPNLLQGNGYASGVFYGDLLLYIPAVLRLAGFSLQASYRLFVFLINTATVLVGYRCFARISGSRAVGLLGTALYSLNLYRLTNLYVRAAVGEYSAMLFLPLILFALWGVFTKDPAEPGYSRLWIPGVVGYGGLILTHILTCGMAAIFTVLACLVCIRRILCRKTFAVLARIVIYTTLCCLWFLVPFGDYMLTGSFRINGEGYSIWHTVMQSAQPLQLLDFFARGGGANAVLADGITDDISFTVGGALLLAGLLYPALRLLVPGARPGRNGRFAALCLGFGVLSLWMATALFPWAAVEKIPGLSGFISAMQYNWRFVALAGLFLAGAAVAGLESLRRLKKEWFAGVSLCLCLTMLLTGGYFLHDVFQARDALFYYETGDILADTDHTAYGKQLQQISMGEYLPASSHPDELWSQTGLAYNAEAVTVSDYSKQGVTAEFYAENHAGEAQVITVPFICYKGYRAWGSGEPLPVTQAENSQVQVTLPAGFAGQVTVRFTEPSYWRAAELISLCSLAGLWGAAVWRARRKKKQ